jgi:type II secretory pathway component PulF
MRAMQRSEGGRQAIDRLVLRVPLGGALVRKLETARFTRNLGVMLGQGVPALQALEVANAAIAQTTLRQAVGQVKESVREGMSLSDALGASGQFPVFVSNLVAVGEESGTLETALLKVASSYERETDRTLRVLTTVLEPLLIVVVGLIVMFIVISMLLPIFQLGLVAQ